MKKIQQFVRLSWAEQRLFITVVGLTAIIRFALLILPFRWLQPMLGTQMTESQLEVDKASQHKAQQVGRMVERVSRYTPWQSKCLVQALAAKLLLRRQGITNTLYLGVGKDASNALIAHAWLRCGNTILTGSQGRERFVVVGKFSDGDW
ncbi:lasso peptide biosynthesis B2 protein [Sporomusa sp. KB1]|jgi:hypothetical protein|uniref:lasso peptide biosynthesis B2 protein n=1 Tax=Sporomusa sp. KB1 TaxID=943346 RepID=UPI0011ABA42E|nr:lasso peptide biosynthesis B2 protein [Sporomusa sp. KB1]TWH45940.1 transglutaminase superfamily protein [Sporomusa sp. KB1]